jgi:hypothetical protein
MEDGPIADDEEVNVRMDAEGESTAKEFNSYEK